jgi:hypothetical protein
MNPGWISICISWMWHGGIRIFNNPWKKDDYQFSLTDISLEGIQQSAITSFVDSFEIAILFL